MAGEAREQLLTRVVAFVARHGVGSLSLRTLADGIGTSHRMLIYHFGSKEGLLVAVIGVIDERQRAALNALDLDPANSPADVIRSMWRRMSDPAMWPYERLFFELYGQALHGQPGAAPLLEGIVDSWLGLNAEMAARWGMPVDTARAHARLGLAVVRGLVLDLLATGDRAGTDAAIEAFAANYERTANPGPG